MSHVSSLANSSYPYRGTLSRLDKNGDGVLSREELAADQRPGLLEASSDDDGDNSASDASGSLMAKLLNVSLSNAGVPQSGSSSAVPQMVSVAVPGNAADLDGQAAFEAYRNTYGQYDLGDMAA
jgi:hypothetical protein